MKKYVVVYNDFAEVICQNLADAEEYILSRAEEDLYEEMLVDVWDNWCESPQAYIQSYAENFAHIGHHFPYSSIYTTNAFMLYRKGINYFIYEIEELD